MKILQYLLAVLTLHLIACATPAKPDVPVVVHTVSTELSEQVARISSEALYCDGSLSAEGPNSVTGRPDCRNGDSMLWSGLYYAAYPKSEVGDAIRRSIGPDNRPYRSPENRKADTVDTFSRDMWTGLMAYCLRADDHATCNGVWDYAKSNDWHTCPDSPDDRCFLTHSMLYLTGYVWASHGWYISEEARASQPERYFDELATIQSAKDVAPGYRLHLIASRMYLYHRMGRMTEPYKKAMKIVLDRDPTDLFYQYTWALVSGDEGLKASVAEQLLVHMKAWRRQQSEGYSQWVWGDSVTRFAPAHHKVNYITDTLEFVPEVPGGESRMHQSMGHDLVFLACNIVECK